MVLVILTIVRDCLCPECFFLGGSDFPVLKVGTVSEQFVALQKHFEAFEYVSEAFSPAEGWVFWGARFRDIVPEVK